MTNQTNKIEALKQEITDLKALIASLNTTVASHDATIKSQHLLIETQYQQILLLRQGRFGRKTEKLPNEAQLELQFDEIEASAAQPDEMPEEAETEAQTITYTRNKKGRGRQTLPKNLPYVEKIHDLTEAEKQCPCGCTLTYIGDEITEQLDIVPQMAFRIVHIRKKYACKSGCEDTVKRAPMPRQLIPRSIASPGLLASIIDSKFNRHLPLYRQEAMFAEAGVPVTRATFSQWLIQASEQLLPLVKLMHSHIEDYDIAYADETTLQVLRQKDKSPTAKSFMWLFAGGPPDKRVFIYQYHPSREHRIPDDFFQAFKGYLHADAYQAYVNLGKKEGINHVACMAHARRYFVDAIKISSNKKGLAHQIVEQMAQLYALEKQLKEQKASPESIYKIRQDKATPILQTIKETIEKNITKILPKSPLGKAVFYLLGNWEALNNYLLDGRLDIDNNLSERAIKPFVIGRKNWLFHGNDTGARAGAIFYSLIATCKYHHIDPFSWFKYTLTHIHQAQTIGQLEQLLPFNISPDLLVNERTIPELIFPPVGAVN